uniref:Uncharacterized protein n=1 Tax=Arundo donax TaxID=35708 RepID=A0A0A8Y6V1_ARUDO
MVRELFQENKVLHIIVAWDCMNWRWKEPVALRCSANTHLGLVAKLTSHEGLFQAFST